MKNNKKSISLIIKLSLAAMGSVVIAVIIVSWISYNSSKELLDQATIDSMKESMSRQIERLSGSIDLVREDVLFISQSDEIQGLLRARANFGYDDLYNLSEKDWRKRIEKSFSILINVKGYQQIRFIGFENDGKEIIRVDKGTDDLQTPIITGVDSLQKKGNLLYVKEGYKLKEGQTYISSITLNREFGFIEQPWNPTQRFVVPVFKKGRVKEDKASKDQILLAGSIKYLNEILKTSIQMAVESKDKKWLERYYSNIPLMEKALFNAALSVSSSEKETFDNFNKVNKKMELLTAKILEQVNKEKWEKASMELYSSEYLFMSENYNSQINSIFNILTNPQEWKTPIGIIVINTNGQNLIDKLENSELYYITMTNTTGGIIRQKNNNLVWDFEFGTKQGINELYPEAWNNLIADNSNNIVRDNKNGLIHLVDKIPLTNTESNEFLGLIMTASEKNILANITSLKYKILVVSLLAVLISGFISAFTVYHLTRPIKKLTNQAEQIARGVKNVKIKITGNDEISKLSKAFVNLFENLNKHSEKIAKNSIDLENSNKKLQLEIIQRQKVEEDLLVAIHESESANKAKSEFLSGMSHELRTPLNAILGFSQILEGDSEKQLSELQKGFVSNILESGNHLLSLINDILDLSKIEAGKIELSIAPLNIKELLTSSLTLIKTKSSEHNISLELKLDETVKNMTIEADGRKLKQIMYNILSNAVKFTPDNGYIIIKASVYSGFLKVSVKDSGIGINLKDQELIFQKFFQTEGGLVNKSKGTGLGLNIVKNLVELHKGKLEVESEGLNKGTTFTFTIPVKFKENM